MGTTDNQGDRFHFIGQDANFAAIGDHVTVNWVQGPLVHDVLLLASDILKNNVRISMRQTLSDLLSILGDYIAFRRGPQM